MSILYKLYFMWKSFWNSMHSVILDLFSLLAICLIFNTNIILVITSYYISSISYLYATNKPIQTTRL